MSRSGIAAPAEVPPGLTRVFGDDEALAAILRADAPLACKLIGRAVRNYDDARWASARVDLVVAGNIAKFGQNAPLSGGRCAANPTRAERRPHREAGVTAPRRRRQPVRPSSGR